MSPAKAMPHTRSSGKSISGQHLWMVLTVFIAGFGFVYKFFEFAKTWVEGELLGFAVVPLIIYCLIASGFACLLAWAVVGGQFRGVEEPKFRMIERELGGDDPPAQPFDAAALSPGARWVGRVAAGAGGVTMAWLLWVLLGPAAAPAALL